MPLAVSEDSDQTEQMLWLIRVLTGCTDYCVGFVMSGSIMYDYQLCFIPEHFRQGRYYSLFKHFIEKAWVVT